MRIRLPLKKIIVVKINIYAFLTVPRCCFFCESFLLFVFHVCTAVLSVPCSLVVTCWERADLLAFLCVMFSCVFVTFLYSVMCQVRYLIISIPGIYLLRLRKNINFILKI